MVTKREAITLEKCGRLLEREIPYLAKEYASSHKTETGVIGIPTQEEGRIVRSLSEVGMIYLPTLFPHSRIMNSGEYI